MSMYWEKDNFEHDRLARVEAERVLQKNQKVENIRDIAIVLSVIAVLGALLWTGPRKPEVARAVSSGLATSGPVLPSEPIGQK